MFIGRPSITYPKLYIQIHVYVEVERVLKYCTHEEVTVLCFIFTLLPLSKITSLKSSQVKSPINLIKSLWTVGGYWGKPMQTQGEHAQLSHRAVQSNKRFSFEYNISNISVITCFTYVHSAVTADSQTKF